MDWDDYRYTEEAHRMDLKIHWKCDSCGHEREDYPNVNEGGKCYSCNHGTYQENGESYNGI